MTTNTTADLAANVVSNTLSLTSSCLTLASKAVDESPTNVVGSTSVPVIVRFSSAPQDDLTSNQALAIVFGVFGAGVGVYKTANGDSGFLEGAQRFAFGATMGAAVGAAFGATWQYSVPLLALSWPVTKLYQKYSK